MKWAEAKDEHDPGVLTPEEVDQIMDEVDASLDPEYVREWGHTLKNQRDAALAVIGGLGEHKSDDDDEGEGETKCPLPLVDTKVRHVRTQAGVRRYGLPLGSPIVGNPRLPQ